MATYAQQSDTDSRILTRLFRTASRIMARIYHRHDHASHSQIHTLSIIREYGSISQKELMTILDVRSSSLSEILLKLELNGSIRREKNPDDKRGFIISACNVPEPNPVKKAHDDEEEMDLFTCLNSKEKEQLKSILEKLVQSLKKETDLSLPADTGRKHKTGRGAKPVTAKKPFRKP